MTKGCRIAVGLALLCLLAVSGANRFPPGQLSPVVKAAQVLNFYSPAVTHGFQKTASLPNGDLFLLPKSFWMGVTDPPPGAQVFTINDSTFGDEGNDIGALPTTKPQGLSLSTPNTQVRAVSCAESIWDTNFLIASTGGTDGDTVRLFTENLDGSKGPELGLFTISRNGVVVTSKHPHLMLFVNNRLATGPSTGVGSRIDFVRSAGPFGLRTQLLTLAWPMGIFSELQGCFRIGVEISRGSTIGSTSVVIADIVVNRNPSPGDENNLGFGLLARLTGGYPTGFPCKDDCGAPDEPIPNPPVPIPQPPFGGDDCNAICFRSPQYFLFNVNSLPYGVVLIGGANHNAPISTSNKRLLTLALRGGITPLQKLNQEFVAAQLNALLAGGEGSVKYHYAMEGKLKCYGMEFAPITLSNGFVLSPETRLKKLFREAKLSIFEARSADQLALAGIFDQLNGNDPTRKCNNLWDQMVNANKP